MTRLVLDHPFKQAPEPGTLTEVAPGVFWLRMPLPFALDHVNLWALEDGDGWTLVDTGLGTDETKAIWDTLFAGPLAGRPVKRLIATHFHPDHMGLASWLCERTGVTLTATLTEWTFGRMLTLEGGGAYLDNQLDYYRRCGYTPELLAGIAERNNTYRTRALPIPTHFRRIMHGDELAIGGRSWRVFQGGGHSPEHACLFSAEDRLLISGDQILPRISPIVGVWPQEPEADPLSLFLDTLVRLKELPADTLVLPSHKLPFKGLRERADDLIHHHQVRLEAAWAACAEPVTALVAMKTLFPRELDPHQTGFATGETMAHLHRLIAEKKMAREARADGVWLYRRL